MNSVRKAIGDWFALQQKVPFDWQESVWEAIPAGRPGMLNAPTGSGKTYAMFLGALCANPRPGGLRVLWITPLRALAKDAVRSMQEAADAVAPGVRVALRTGDTPAAEKARQERNPPHTMVITPESLHVLLSRQGASAMFASLTLIVVDEWHELLGSKRGVQTELAIARLRTIAPDVLVWGVSATIGNMAEATAVLHGRRDVTVIRATVHKNMERITILPDAIERFPWSGHMGLLLLEKAEHIVASLTSTLVFTNTRNQAEVWYQQFLDAYDHYAGTMALHHGSLDQHVRTWVEDALHAGTVKVVFCTASLDLGVDFTPVDGVIQVGSPKSVARYLQRAGRSGHRPGATSRIWLLPTQALELVEAAALHDAVEAETLESRRPILEPMDVLVQWLVTLACGEGFTHDLVTEVRSTYAYQHLSDDRWAWAVDFVTRGGVGLQAYEDFHKVRLADDGRYRIASRSQALRHRLSIGTISSDAMIAVKLQRGSTLGHIEESFIGKLEEGSTFWFAGRCLEFIRVRDMVAEVRPSTSTTGIVPQWIGGRMPLSSSLAQHVRMRLHEAANGHLRGPEMTCVRPVLDVQERTSRVPRQDELLMEELVDRDGHHLFVYPFEGRLVHEGMAALFALRLASIRPASYSLAMNDYGFEILSDSPIPLTEALQHGLLSTSNLSTDILGTVNAALLARRRFRDISRIAGLVFNGFPSKQKRARQLQASSELFFDVFTQYDASNALLQQAHEEALLEQLDEERMRLALERMNTQKLIRITVEGPSPFGFPILVDRLRERLSTEKLEDRIKKMQAHFVGAEAAQALPFRGDGPTFLAPPKQPRERRRRRRP
jgi:ATP-dependent Lhr-like helicase